MRDDIFFPKVYYKSQYLVYLTCYFSKMWAKITKTDLFNHTTSYVIIETVVVWDELF